MRSACTTNKIFLYLYVVISLWILQWTSKSFYSPKSISPFECYFPKRKDHGPVIIYLFSYLFTYLLVKHACSITSWGLTILFCGKVAKQLDFLCISGISGCKEVSIICCITPKAVIVLSSVFSLQCLQRNFHRNLEIQVNLLKVQKPSSRLKKIPPALCKVLPIVWF